VPRHTGVPPNFFENVLNRTLRTVLFMAYPQGVPRRKKGWPPQFLNMFFFKKKKV
jgi:hypothetical protein